jgi:hypothetical protein
MKTLGHLGLSLAIAVMVVAATPLAVFAQDTSAVTVHPIASVPPVKVTAPQSLPSWVNQADRFIHIIKGTATIDSAAASHLDATTLAHAQQAIDSFNSLPLSARSESYPIAGPVLPASAPGTVRPMVSAGCMNGSNYAIYWWGIHIKFSECATQLLYPGVAGIGAIVGTVGAVFAGASVAVLVAVGPYIAAIGGFIAVASFAIWAEDSFVCDNRGVSINYGWVPFVGNSIGC